MVHAELLKEFNLFKVTAVSHLIPVASRAFFDCPSKQGMPSAHAGATSLCRRKESPPAGQLTMKSAPHGVLNTMRVDDDDIRQKEFSGY